MLVEALKELEADDEFVATICVDRFPIKGATLWLRVVMHGSTSLLLVGIKTRCEENSSITINSLGSGKMPDATELLPSRPALQSLERTSSPSTLSASRSHLPPLAALFISKRISPLPATITLLGRAPASLHIILVQI